MKFKSRNQEYAFRLALATILVIFLGSFMDDQRLVTYLFPNKVLRSAVVVLSIMLIGWLNWGKLITPQKQKN